MVFFSWIGMETKMSITKNINKAVFTWRWHWAVSSASTSTREALLASSESTTSSALNSVAGSSWPCSLLNLMGGKIIVTIQKGIMLWSDSWSPYWKCARMCLLWWWCHMELLMRVLWQRYQKKGCHLEAPLVSSARYWLHGFYLLPGIGLSLSFASSANRISLLYSTELLGNFRACCQVMEYSSVVQLILLCFICKRMSMI